MGRPESMLRRLARPDDRRLLDESSGLWVRLGVVARVARFVGGVVEQEAGRLETLLGEHGGATPSERGLLASIRKLRETSLSRAGVAVVDGDRRVVAAELGGCGLPPPDVLLPALRHAEQGGRAVATDLWRGQDGRPMVALVVGQAREPGWRAAVMLIRLDGEDFQRLFRYFVINEESRLQLLDSSGVALFSTRADEQHISVIHGTYFSDRVRLGEPVAMRCHSCHPEEGTDAPTRETEVTTVVPVPATGWSVNVREGTRNLFAPIREIAFSSIALVSVILGAFVGFFALLSRRVLGPVHRLISVAAGNGGGAHSPTLAIDPGDELASLASSLQALRRQGDEATGARRGNAGAVPLPPREDLRRILRPDVLVLDIAMPDLGGLEVLAELRSEKLRTRVAIVSQYSDRAYVIRALRLGAKAYLPKKALSKDLVAAIEAILDGRTYLDPSVADVVVDAAVHPESAREPDALALLTPREREVLRLTAEGRTAKEVARLLDISVHTANRHRANLMEKLDLHGKADLVRLAVRLKLVDP